MELIPKGSERPTSSDSASGAVSTQKKVAVLKRNWRAEIEGAATYRELAAMERDERRRDILIKMGEAEERHAKRWADRIAELGDKVNLSAASAIGPSQSVILSARVGGLEVALKKVEDNEEEHVKSYQNQARELDDAPSNEILADLIRDEGDHAQTIRAMMRTSPEPRGRLDDILKRERWHSSSGSWIGDAIYGVNDGLTAVFGIVTGVAAASASHQAIVIAGIAGMLSSALSMGASAYLANKSEREVFEAELDRERLEIEEHPDEEKEELALFYQLKGFSEDESVMLSDRLFQRPKQFLETLAQEELGLAANRLPNPYYSAGTGTLSTALGAIVPVFPFFFWEGATAIVISAVVSIVAHFLVGAAKSLVTARSWWKSGLEMTVVAIVVAGLAYLVGLALGSSGG